MGGQAVLNTLGERALARPGPALLSEHEPGANAESLAAELTRISHQGHGLRRAGRAQSARCVQRSIRQERVEKRIREYG